METEAKSRRREQNKIAQRKYRHKVAAQADRTERLAQRALDEALKTRGPVQCTECAHCQARMSQASVSSHENDNTSSEPLADSNVDAQPVQLLPALFASSCELDEAFQMDMATWTSSIGEPVTLVGAHDEPQCTIPQDCQSFAGTAQTHPRDTLTEDAESLPQPDVDSASRQARAILDMDAALLLASMQGHVAIIATLLRNGAAVDARDQEDRTALQICVGAGHIEAAKVLVEAGADVNAVDKQGVSVIIAAVLSGNEAMVECLLHQ